MLTERVTVEHEMVLSLSPPPRCAGRGSVRDAMLAPHGLPNLGLFPHRAHPRASCTASCTLAEVAHPANPAKLLFYTATCFVRVGDAERAEDYARE
jgi:hypothetical protein